MHKSGNIFISGNWYRVYYSFDCHQRCAGICELNSVFKHLYHRIRSPLLQILMYHSICQQLADSNFRKTDNWFSCRFYNNLFLRNNRHNILCDFLMRKCIACTEFFFSDGIQSGILLIPYHPDSSSMQRFKFLQIFCNHQCSHIRDIPCAGIISFYEFFML